MPGFAFDLWDLSLFSAVTAIILLVTSELLSPSHGRINVKIDRARLRNVAIVTTIAFLTTVLARIISIYTF